jgi:hypothetical protein
MSEMNRFVEAAVITALFAACVLFVNYNLDRGACGKASAALIERGPGHIVAN